MMHGNLQNSLVMKLDSYCLIGNIKRVNVQEDFTIIQLCYDFANNQYNAFLIMKGALH